MSARAQNLLQPFLTQTQPSVDSSKIKRGYIYVYIYMSFAKKPQHGIFVLLSHLKGTCILILIKAHRPVCVGD